MIGKQIIVLLSLAFLAAVTLADSNVKTFREKWIEWGKNPHIDQFGGFVDVDAECDGKPCNYPKEIVPYTSEELSGPFCVPTNNDQVICNSLPQNATMVSESEFDRIFPGSSNSIPEPPQPPKLLAYSKGSVPQPSQTSQVSSTSKGSIPQPSETSQVSSASKGSVPQPSQTSQLFSASKRSIPKPSQASHPRLASNGTSPKHVAPPSKLEKRSRFILDTSSQHFVWQSKAKITYRIAFTDHLKSQKLKVTTAVLDGVQYWKEKCGSPAKQFFENWTFLDEASSPDRESSPTANIWFYFVRGSVCGNAAAYACAFFPHDYGKRGTIYVNWDKFKNRSPKAISMIMAHEIGHVLGLAHENIYKTTKDGIENSGDHIPLWKTSTYDEGSIMHSYFDISKELTKTDCRTMSFYNKGFNDLKCGLVDGRVEVCKKRERHFIKPKVLKLDTKEVLIDTGSGLNVHLADVAEYECVGSDMSQYILNNSHASKTNKHGYVNVGFGLTQCLGIRVPSDPDYAHVMQSDGNFVSYNTKTGKAVWSTGSQGLGIAGDYSISFQGDGNLVIYDKYGTATWSSGTHLGSPSAFRLNVGYWQFHDGKMMLTDKAGKAAWATVTNIYAHTDVLIELKGPDGRMSGYCMDVHDKKAILNECDGRNENQRWNIFVHGQIISKSSGLCLALQTPKLGNEEQVRLVPCETRKEHLWQLRGDGSIMNRSQNRCLDNRGQQLKVLNPIQVYDCYNVWSEKWFVGEIP